jgi:hypothetical protein
VNLVGVGCVVTVNFDEHERDFLIFIVPRCLGITLWSRRVSAMSWLIAAGGRSRFLEMGPRTLEDMIMVLRELDERFASGHECGSASISAARRIQRELANERQNRWERMWSAQRDGMPR